MSFRERRWTLPPVLNGTPTTRTRITSGEGDKADANGDDAPCRSAHYTKEWQSRFEPFHRARHRISHPDRLIYPDLGISKIQLARYYETIADWIVPHVAGRPLTLVHCPAGLAAPCIYLKHAKAWGPSALRRIKIQEKTKIGEYLVADSIEAVVSVAQMGIVEVHT